MEVIKMDEIEGITNKRGVTAKQLHKNEDVQIMNLVLKPGDEVPSHSVPVNVFFYVVSGRGTIAIGDEEAEVKQDDIIPCPKNTEMALSADRGEDFSVINVK
ncbi:cupin domain-containing protein, partial [Halarsenatibacter silvermanii]